MGRVIGLTLNLPESPKKMTLSFKLRHLRVTEHTNNDDSRYKSGLFQGNQDIFVLNKRSEIAEGKQFFFFSSSLNLNIFCQFYVISNKSL